MTPAVSVVIPSYNHARYIRAAIESVLGQTVPPAEVIVVDDGSTDQSASLIRELSSASVKAILLGTNRGACAALNEGISQAAGDFIAVCNSDDIWVAQKLERQLRLLADRPGVGAVFSDAEFIGDDGSVLSEPPPKLRNAFTPVDRSRSDWMRGLIKSGNRLCHPSILARRRVYEEVGGYDNRFRQLPDLEMWLRLVERFEIHVMRERLVKFRLHTSNTSQPSPGASVRDRNEFAVIVEEFFRRVSADNLALAFGSVKARDDPAWSLAVERIVCLLSAGTTDSPVFNYVACRLAMDLLKIEDGLRAWEAYGFTVADFHTLHGLTSPWVSRETLGPWNSDELKVAKRLMSPETAVAQSHGQATWGRRKYRLQKVIDLIRRKNASVPWG